MSQDSACIQERFTKSGSRVYDLAEVQLAELLFEPSVFELCPNLLGLKLFGPEFRRACAVNKMFNQQNLDTVPFVESTQDRKALFSIFFVF